MPQLKESISLAERVPSVANNESDCEVDLGSDSAVNDTWKRHIVFGGTSLIQHTPPSSSLPFDDNSSTKVLDDLPAPPDGGCVALVVRTAFGTTQGALMRKILFSCERVNVDSSETFYFIGVLVVFAILASTVVLMQGMRDENRNKFRLVLHCIMILTSVVNMFMKLCPFHI